MASGMTAQCTAHANGARIPSQGPHVTTADFPTEDADVFDGVESITVRTRVTARTPLPLKIFSMHPNL